MWGNISSISISHSSPSMLHLFDDHFDLHSQKHHPSFDMIISICIFTTHFILHIVIVWLVESRYCLTMVEPRVVYQFTNPRFIKCILMTLVSSHTSLFGQCIYFVLRTRAYLSATSKNYYNPNMNVDMMNGSIMTYIHTL
jgi:hypothetical protein